MLYSPTPPSHQGRRVRLYFSPQAARADCHGDDIFKVAVHFDGLFHRLLPLRPLPEQLDPTWTVLAEGYQGESVVAFGPIPPPLFSRDDPSAPEVGRDHGPR